MHVRDVVALEKVVDIDLPVAGDVIADAVMAAVVFQSAIRAEARIDAGNEGIEVGCLGGIDGGEYQSLPDLHRKLRQADFGWIEVHGIVHFRGRFQHAVQAVVPAVVAAAQRLRGQPVALRDRPGAMPAHVVEHADDIVGTTHRDDRQACEVADDVIAGIAQLAHMRDQLPAAIEHHASVDGLHGCVDVVTCRQRSGGRVGLRGEIRVCVHAGSMASSPAISPGVAAHGALALAGLAGGTTRMVLPAVTSSCCGGSKLPSACMGTNW